MLMDIPRMGCQRGEAALCQMSRNISSQLGRCCIWDAAVASFDSAVRARLSKRTRVNRPKRGNNELGLKDGSIGVTKAGLKSHGQRDTIVPRYYSSLDRGEGVGVNPADTRDGGQEFALP